MDKETIKQLEKELKEYSEICNANLNTINSRKTYIGYAGMFVRWIKGEFIPGEFAKMRRN